MQKDEIQIAIISDSHYSVDRVRQLFNHLRELDVQHLIHAGDFIGNGIDKVFKDFPDIQSWVARGNCDSQWDVIDTMSNFPHITIGDVLRFELSGVSFLVSHIPGTVFSALSRQNADVVIHGHTHKARVEKYNGALLLNPGSLMDGDGYMILKVPKLTVERNFNF